MSSDKLHVIVLYWKLRLLSHSSFLRTLLCCPSSSSTYFVMKFLPAVTNCMFEQLCVFLGIPEFKRDIAVILYLQIIFTSLICYFLNKHCPLTYCLFLSLKHCLYLQFSKVTGWLSCQLLWSKHLLQDELGHIWGQI